MGLSWQAALGAVFCSGVLMLVLSVLPVREWVVNSIPRSQKMAIAGGIGFFLVIIGLRNAGARGRQRGQPGRDGQHHPMAGGAGAAGIRGDRRAPAPEGPGRGADVHPDRGRDRVALRAFPRPAVAGGPAAVAGPDLLPARYRRRLRTGAAGDRLRLPDGGPLRHQRDPGGRAQRGRAHRTRKARFRDSAAPSSRTAPPPWRARCSALPPRPPTSRAPPGFARADAPG